MLKKLYLLPLLFLLALSSACNPCQPSKPRVQTVVPVGQYGQLSDEYFQQMDAHKNDITVRIELPKTQYAQDELLEFQVTITNMTDDSIVIRRPDAEIWEYPHPLSPVIFTLIPDDPSISIEFWGSSIIGGYFEILPEEFVTLRAGCSFTATVPILPRPRGLMPVGKYSVSAEYGNSEFGSDPGEDQEEEVFLLDYGAWIGTITSNSIDFEVIAQPRK